MRAAWLFACTIGLLLLNPFNLYAQNGGSIAGTCTGAYEVANLSVKVKGVDEPVYYVGCDVKPPEVISEPKPQPGGLSGGVVLTMIVTSKADITNIRIVSKGADATQDARAIEAAHEYKFKPAAKDGKPVSVEIAVEIDFRT